VIAPLDAEAARRRGAVLALAAAPARADQPPAFTTSPTIAAEAIVGSPLRVVAGWTGTPAPTPLYEWQRCDVTGMTCEVVAGACGATYVPTFDDFGERLLARVRPLQRRRGRHGAHAAQRSGPGLLGRPTGPAAAGRLDRCLLPGPWAPARCPAA
jgi:hypothetical protein